MATSPAAHRLFDDDDALSSKGDAMYVEGCAVEDLARRFGTPLFVLSGAKLRSNVQRWRNALARDWPGAVDILPAFKANTTLASRHILSDEGAGADVYSESELHAVLTTGVDRERVSVNGGGKSESLLRRCVEEGVRITVEDLDEPERIDAIARELGRVAKIRFRVKPDFPSLWRPTDFTDQYASIDMGIQAYKSGIPHEYIADLGRRVFDMRNVELVGLHVHVGRHHASLWFWRRVIKHFGDFVVALCKEWGDWRPQELDVGGGFAGPRDPFHKLGNRKDVLSSVVTYPFELALRLLGNRRRYRATSMLIDKVMARAPSSFRAPSIEAYGHTVATVLADRLRRGGLDPAQIRLQAEPGRGMYGDAGIHVASVKRVKRQTRPVALRWILTDTTYFFLAGGTFEAFLHDFVVANKVTAPATCVADVVGHSCAADRILPFVRVPELEQGDLIALLDTGAYQEVSASNFNGLPRPATVLVCGTKADVVREGETVSDVYQRDRVPAELLGTTASDPTDEAATRGDVAARSA
ncbi:MAG: hypothetical protein AAF721_16585 [Myxococcota bacterium]